MNVVYLIEDPCEATLSQSYGRKAEACFLLVSRIAPFYREYATVAGGRLDPFYPE